MENNLNVSYANSQFNISGEALSDDIHKGEWHACKLDHGRIPVVSKASGSEPNKSTGFARCSIDMLHDLLVGFNHRRWTGIVSVDTGFGQKKLFFNKGELTFAGSSLIDDRLGEVIYREGLITMDQLTDSAVQVDRNTKFGQVLLKDKIFTITDLWKALKSQVREILYSVFMSDSAFIEIFPGKPPTEVTFDEGTLSIIEAAHSAGSQFRTFFKRLRAGGKIHVVESPKVAEFKVGTFIGDVFDLVRKHSDITDFLAVSKLTDLNSLWVIHRLSCLGYVNFTGLEEVAVAKADSSFANLRGKLDAFSMLSTMAQKAFDKAGVAFPIGEVQDFALSLNTGQLAAIYLDSHCMMSPDCLGNIVSQCHANGNRVSYFEVRVDSLSRYLLQIAGDLLPFQEAKNLRVQFAEFDT